MRPLPRCLLAVALALAGSARASAAGGAGAILVLARDDGEEERALLDALRIYTRDLGCDVIAGRGMPPALVAGELARVEEEGLAAGAALVVWLADEGGEPALLALRTGGGPLSTTPIEADDPEVAARTLALKIRALYVRPASERPAGWRPVEVAPAARAAPRDAGSARVTRAAKTDLGDEPSSPPSTVPGARAVARPAARAAARSDFVASAGARGRPLGIEVGVAYDIDLPTSDLTWLRQGVLLRAAVLLSRVPLAVEIDGAITTHPSGGSGGSTVSVYDVPLGVAVTLRLVRGRFALVVGPRASMHVIEGSATTADGRVGSERRYGAGVGALVQGRVALTSYTALAVTLGGEALLPRRVFTVDGAPAIDLGPFQFAASAGLVFRVF